MTFYKRWPKASSWRKGIGKQWNLGPGLCSNKEEKERQCQRYIKKSEAMNQQHSKLRLYICLQCACSQKFEDNVIWNSPPVREQISYKLNPITTGIFPHRPLLLIAAN